MLPFQWFLLLLCMWPEIISISSLTGTTQGNCLCCGFGGCLEPLKEIVFAVVLEDVSETDYNKPSYMIAKFTEGSWEVPVNLGSLLRDSISNTVQHKFILWICFFGKNPTALHKPAKLRLPDHTVVGQQLVHPVWNIVYHQIFTQLPKLSIHFAWVLDGVNILKADHSKQAYIHVVHRPFVCLDYAWTNSYMKLGKLSSCSYLYCLTMVLDLTWCLTGLLTETVRQHPLQFVTSCWISII